MTARSASTVTMLSLALLALVVLILFGVAASPSISVLPANFDAGLAADGSSSSPAISADGRYVAFTSSANNLSNDDQDRFTNVFVRDLVTNTTTLVSRQSTSLGGRAANGSSSAPTISGDGRRVVFVSTASNLTPRGIRHSQSRDVFVRDLVGGTTTLVSGPDRSTRPWGTPWSPRISANGRVVAFGLTRSVAGGRADLIVVRHDAGMRTIAAPAAPASTSDTSSRATVVEPGRPELLPDTEPPPRFRKFDLSADGKHVAFVAEGPRIDDRRLYYRRLSDGRNQRLRTRGVVSDDEPLTISTDGRFIAYHDDPAGGSVVNTRTRTRRELGCDENGRSCLWKLGVDQGRFASSCEDPVLSANGRLVACRSSEPRVGPLDPSTPRGIVTRSLVTGRMTCALCAPLPDTPDTPIPKYGKLALSGDGRMIAFVTERAGLGTAYLTDVYVLNTRTGQTTLVSRQSGPVT